MSNPRLPFHMMTCSLQDLRHGRSLDEYTQVIARPGSLNSSHFLPESPGASNEIVEEVNPVATMARFVQFLPFCLASYLFLIGANRMYTLQQYV